jgi:hypothetical protein
VAICLLAQKQPETIQGAIPPKERDFTPNVSSPGGVDENLIRYSDGHNAHHTSAIRSSATSTRSDLVCQPCISSSKSTI